MYYTKRNVIELSRVRTSYFFMPEISLKCKGEKELDQVAEQILTVCKPARIFAFFGKLGAGKTTLIQHICKLLGVKEAVTSPTFNLVNEYNGSEESIYHFDFYRIETENEAYDIGTEEYLDSGNYVFIEWPERIASLLPAETVAVQIEGQADNHRTIRVIY